MHSVQNDADKKQGFSPCLPAPRANRTRADDYCEQVLLPPITHHTVYEKTRRSLQRNNACQWGTHYSYTVGPLFRLVGRPHFEPSLSNGVLPLIIAANGPTGTISLTKALHHILFYICNGRYFGVTKSKKRGSVNNRVFCSLKRRNKGKLQRRKYRQPGYSRRLLGWDNNSRKGDRLMFRFYIYISSCCVGTQ